MEVVSDTLPPETDEEEGGDVFSISVSLCELDGTWHNASTCLLADLLTPEAIADALIQCIIGAAAARSPHTLIALQQRLMSWGTTE